MSRATRFLLIGLSLALCVGRAPWAFPPPESSTEDEILKQIKNDVFDEKWESVLADCERHIATYPKSDALARSYYYRARALQHLPGKEEAAVAAYGEIIDKFPSDAVLREEAQISRINLAKSLWVQGKKDSITILTKALDGKGYPRIYAAIQISHLDNKPSQARALPILQECSRGESNAEVRNECTLGILRIDPSAVPAPKPTPQASASEPKLIRLDVRDKKTGSVKVAVNLPIAFAEALMGSLSAIDQGLVKQQLDKQHIDLDNLMKSLRSMGPQTLVEIETEDAKIRVWLE
jgi:hypothetical protein